MKKKLVLTSIVLLVTILVLGLVSWNRHREFQENERFLWDKVRYATRMGFTVSGDYGVGRPVFSHFEWNRQNPNEFDYAEIIFVHYSEEAAQFDEHVLVVWPSRPTYDAPENARSTQGRLFVFLWRMQREYPDVDFRDYGLPADEITLIDVVDNWEIVKAITDKYWSLW
jgi:hypothetical protein